MDSDWLVVVLAANQMPGLKYRLNDMDINLEIA